MIKSRPGSLAPRTNPAISLLYLAIDAAMRQRAIVQLQHAIVSEDRQSVLDVLLRLFRTTWCEPTTAEVYDRNFYVFGDNLRSRNPLMSL